MNEKRITKLIGASIFCSVISLGSVCIFRILQPVAGKERAAGAAYKRADGRTIYVILYRETAEDT